MSSSSNSRVWTAADIRPLKMKQLARMVQPTWAEAEIDKVAGAFPDLGVYKLFHDYPESGHKLSFLLNAALLVVYNKTNDSKTVHLLYDGRYDDRLESVAGLKTYFVVLGPLEQLWRFEQTEVFRPRLVVSDFHKRYRSLSRLLQLQDERPDPKNVAELRAFFAERPPPAGTRVNVNLVCVSVPCRATVYSAKLTFGSEDSPSRVIDLEARPGKNYDFIFREMTQKRVAAAAAAAAAIPPKDARPAEPSRPTTADPKRESLFRKNRSCAIQLNRYGLNLAFDLGLLTPSELTGLSADLAGTVATFTFHRDDCNHLRVLVYHDRRGDPVCLSLDCKKESPEKSLEFFREIESRRQLLAQERRLMLQPLFNKLENTVLKNTKYANLLRFYETMVNKQKIFFYDEGDAFMHDFKFLLGCYLHSKKGLCRLPLRVNALNELVSLQTAQFCVVNLFSYVKATKDETFKSVLKEKRVRIRHWSVHLNKRNKTGEDGTTLDLCLDHSELASRQLLLQWDKLRIAFLEHFGHDISVTNSPTLAKLSYDAVEGRLARLKGILGQGREKLKKPYNNFLRSFNFGGLAFSVQGKLSADQLLNCRSKYAAKKVCQYDVVSSYGFSAATRRLPDKFCNGFFTHEFLERVGAEGQFLVPPTVLVKTDGDRSKTFEFRAAYYTLWKIISTSNRAVRTVYSNFSPFGIFHLNKYVVDLAVVFDDGSLALYNFDSIYSHGCESCPLISKYINNAPLHALRMKTVTRDAKINHWIKNCGLNKDVTYDVFTDCHHEEYSSASLKNIFRVVPELGALSQSCPRPKNLTQAQLLAWLGSNRQKTDYTYLAWVRGAVEVDDDVLTPLVLPPSGKLQTSFALGPSTGDAPVLLTRDYLEFLIDQCNFQVSSIDAILFFGTDPKANELYQNLVTARTGARDPVVADLLKNVTNYSVGFYGRSTDRPRPKYTLTNKMPRPSEARIHRIVSSFGARDVENGPLLFVYKMTRKQTFASNDSSYLPFHLTVIENGKLRLVEFLTFLQEHLHADSFVLLYSNIDSLHLAFGERDWATKLVPPDKHQNFSQKLATFVSDRKIAGRFVLDWTVDEKFMYVTAMTKNYAIVSSGVDKTKWCGVNNIQPLEGYVKSCELLEGGTWVTQERRINKLQDLKTEIKDMFFKPVNK